MSLSSLGTYGEVLSVLKNCLNAYIIESLEASSSMNGHSGMIKLNELLKCSATNIEGTIIFILKVNLKYLILDAVK
jgi:hypothetical protein